MTFRSTGSLHRTQAAGGYGFGEGDVRSLGEVEAGVAPALVIVSAKWSDEGERSHGFDVRWGWSMAAAARFDGDRRYKLSFWHVGLGKTQVVEPET